MRERGSDFGAAVETAGGLRLAAFAGLTALAAWRYAGVEEHPPAGRVIGIAAIAIAAGASLLFTCARDTGPRRARASAAAVRVTLLVGFFAIAVLVAGVPIRLLRPTGWGKLFDDLHGGLQTVGSTLWPYTGHDSWARADLLLALVAVPIAAAALGFWPAGNAGRWRALRFGLRQIAALVLLLALYVIGVLDSNGGSATGEGMLLLGLVAAWLWLPGLRARRVTAAVAWMAAAAALAAPIVGLLEGGQPWLNYRAWGLLGTGGPGTAFSWDQTYGPIRWSRSRRTMFTVSAARPQLWKTTTLDRFDGMRFIRSTSDANSEENLPLPPDDRWYRSATFTIRGLTSEELPSEQGTTVGVNYDGSLRHDGDGTTRTVGTNLHRGATYTVMSYVPNPTPAQLRMAPRA